MAKCQQTRSATLPSLNNESDGFQVELVDLAIRHLLETTQSQYVTFVDQKQRESLQRRSFERFIIGDGPWTFGEWRFGDDIHLHFLTMDNENRWAEVVTEAIGVEVGSKDLNEATKDAMLDLTDDRLCRFRDGRRTQYWYLKNANVAKCRIVLHYCRISRDWLGVMDVTVALRDMILPDWPGTLPKKSYTANYNKIKRLQKVSHDSCWRCMRKIYPFARAWAQANDIWTPGAVDAHVLFHIISSMWTSSRFDPASEGEMLLITVLECMASEDMSPVHVPEACRSALAVAAEETLKDPKTSLAIVRTSQINLAPSPPQQQPITPTLQKSIRRTSFKLGMKFRDARGAINRLRHDTAHSGIEYDVGYLDRFEGMRWMALENWGGKGTEEEDFIPEHRVRQIVRPVDGVVVWDREERVDRTGEV